ncbi:DNA polymerase epsilon subunit C-like [Camellia sinensis]|uniref:Transcription factor CBF/NF-Y/archaeal histone domain-containing protein n=1 Tax=Camellia sinensis var. sinensis TaxID=542762 RepID=A0A4S4EPC9_CAMSN|nr:DNA polymerase epsilon subunit C-like [Camellia sinensis]THG18583.1 hypothetical protein TEA_019137 [Camellia sinensis var. sinensis]
MEDKSQIQSKNKNTNENKKTNSNNGTESDDEPDLLHVVVPNSSSDSQNDGEDQDEDEDEDGVAQVEHSYEDDDNGDDEEATSKEITNQPRNNAKNGDDEGEKEDSTKIKSRNETAASSHCFPIHRISRIIKSEDPDIRIAQESVFLINKASEKFLELFCKEAYGCAFLDRKKHVEYKHMSSVVSKRRRFDFLSDFVPVKAKAKAEDTLSELSSAKT